MFCITEAPPAAEMKLGSSQAEHSLIGIVGSCARIARIAVIESVPRHQAEQDDLRLGGEHGEHLRGDVGGAYLVDLGGHELEAVLLRQPLHTVPWLARQTEPQLSSSSATLV